MKVKALVNCTFEIEYEDQNCDISDTKTNIEMGDLKEIFNSRIRGTKYLITVDNIQKIKGIHKVK